MTDKSTPVLEIFYGFHAQNLIDGAENADTIDLKASAKKYADQIREALTKNYPGAKIKIAYNLDTTGELPYLMRTKVNGETDHDEVQVIGGIANSVYEDFKWIVLK